MIRRHGLQSFGLTQRRVPAGPGEPDITLRGWQRVAARACNESACETHLADLPPTSRALLLSQSGPHSARALTALPTHEAVVIPSAHFRVPLLRRLRLPLPLAPRTCRCRGRLDPLGDHRSACATSGVLAARALPLERAVARVCREAGAAVARNVRVADMNIDVPVVNDRRIEVVANGLPLWHGAQLAVDATLVSPVMRAGEPQTRADVEPGRAVSSAAECKRRYTYPEITRARRCRLVVVGLEVGGSLAPRRRHSSASSHGTALLPCRPGCARLPNPPGFPDGQRYWLLPHNGHMPAPCSSSELPLAGEGNGEGPAPEPHELLADNRWEHPVPASRLPPR